MASSPEHITRGVIERCADCDVCRHLMDVNCLLFPELFRLFDREKEDHKVSFDIEIKDQDSIGFTIKDNGIGMDQETREKAFSLFFSSKGPSGTGLGLFISNRIAEAHGGTLSLENRDEAPGCVARLVLPLN